MKHESYSATYLVLSYKNGHGLNDLNQDVQPTTQKENTGTNQL